MGKKCVSGVVLLLVVLLAIPRAMAAPAYGTKMPEKFQAFWGLQTYRIERRDLNNGNGQIRSQQNFVTLSYGLTDWFSLDLKYTLYSSFTHQGQDGENLEKYGRPGLWGGGYGFRIRLYENGPWKAVTGFQHISTHPVSLKANGVKNNGILDDWGGSTLVSYDLKKFTPYVGVVYSTLNYLHRINNDLQCINSDKHRYAGLAAGVDIPVTERVWFNLESDWRDGGAGTASLNFRF
jgi:hypothetical protein